jgi:hypothetical protein
MAYTTINKSSLHMNTKLYTGNAGTQAVTGVGFQPDMCWFKARNNTDTHAIFDAVRGATKRIIPDNTTAEGIQSNGITSFDSDGFTSGGANITNGSGRNYASWNWKANGAGSANTDGSISSTVSANTTSGFSIVSYTGNGTSGATIGHGLSSAPSMIIFKSISTTNSWLVYHKGIGATKFLRLETTDAEAVASSVVNDTAPTSSIITLGDSGGVNANGVTFIAYCFAEKVGYSKIGSYVGNGNADGSFIYTGFKPALIIMKRSDASGNNWRIFDNKRSTSGFNVIDKTLRPNDSAIEGSSNIDFVSNGVKIRNTDAEDNTSGGTYIYMAFGQSIVGSNNVPCTAR